jgi:hypothetical protein
MKTKIPFLLMFACVAVFGIDSETVSNVVNAIGTANAASAPFNPYAGYIQMGLGLATLIAGMFAHSKNKKLKAVKRAVQDHKDGKISATTLHGTVGQV